MKPEIKYGLLIGLGVCAWILLEFAIGLHTTRMALGEYTGFVSNLIPLVGLYALLRMRLESSSDGRLTLGQGIYAGVLASLVAAVLVYSFLVAYNQVINPGWIDLALDWKVANMRAAGQPEPFIREQILSYRNAYSPTGLVGSILVGMTLMGGIFSLFLTLLLRWRRGVGRSG